MKAPKILRRKPRHLTEDHSAALGQDNERAPVLTSGLRILVLMLQVAGALLSLWRR
jgi:hypothetical protein